MKRFAWTCMSLLLPLSLHAQTWSILPGGVAAYTFPYSTMGNFICNPVHGAITGGSCVANGNQMTLTSGGGVLDFVFHDVSPTTFTATQAPQLASLGQLDISFSGSGPFTFPVSARGTQPLFYLMIELTTTRPIAFLGLGYISTGTSMLTHNCCSDLIDGVEQGGIPAPPAPYQYDALQFFGMNHPDILPEDESLDITAEVRVEPEPATMVLMATGLTWIIGIGRRRKPRITRAR